MPASRVILVLNCGSSSVKGALVEPESGSTLCAARVTRIGSGEARVQIGDEAEAALEGDGHGAAVDAVLAGLGARLNGAELAGIGHRVVHGGESFVAPARIDDQVESAIEALNPLAPLHNPANLAGIRAARKRHPEVLHVAVFDTAFHATLPRRAAHYALEAKTAARHGVRRYGFHGPSHQYVAGRAAAALDAEPDQLRLITCHLGNGASVCAVEYGRSIETSMGMTPVEGLVMGTRSGDVDAGALLAIARAEGWDLDAIDEFINRRGGLAGLSKRGKDMRDIEAGAAEGDDACRLAMQVFCHRVRKYIGAYAAVMGGVDAIVFTGGIGENSATIRHRICQRLDFLGVRLDEDANRELKLSREHDAQRFSEPNARCHLLAVKTDEQLAIARAAARLAAERDRVKDPGPIPIAVSARHIHLTQESVDVLFGKGHELTPYKPLSQPGQFACEEKLTIVGPKSSISGVRVLGPIRRKNQVEISRTDEFALGIDAPVRGSGKTEGSAPCKLVGPAGELSLHEGVICAWRHIHMQPHDAEAYGVQHGDIVEVAVDSGGRDLIFGDVLVRVSPKYKLEMHIDTDEANAAELSRMSEGMLVPTPGEAHLRSKQSRRAASDQS